MDAGREELRSVGVAQILVPEPARFRALPDEPPLALVVVAGVEVEEVFVVRRLPPRAIEIEECGPKVRLGLNETLAPLIVARFVCATRAHVARMDDEGMTRRLPSAGDLPPGAFEQSGDRLVALADLAEGWDRDSAEGDGDGKAVAAGCLAFHPELGLAPVHAAHGSKSHLIDLSKAPGAMVRRFTKFVRVVESDGWYRQAVERRLAQIRSSK